jgi:DNA adenine methylase
VATELESTYTVERDRSPRPFLKWVGGKGQILGEIRQFYPAELNKYYEPFVGGGAVFFDLLPKKAIISDSNKELINCYKIVKSKVEELIETLQEYVYDKERYYAVREEDPSKLDPVARAARTIYLNRTGFNGLYRVNQKGKFNVPFGRHTNPTICDETNLRGCSKALKRITLRSASFEKVLSDAEPDDFVYFDPPYIPVSDTSYFTSYQKSGFGMDNQEKLACVFEELAQRGVKVLLSNSDVPWMHDRFHKFNIHTLFALRSINSNTKKRGAVSEVLISSY